MVYIDGQGYDVTFHGVKRQADMLWKYFERTENGGSVGELIGVYYNFSLELKSAKNMTVYNEFYAKITEPTEFHTIMLPTENGQFITLEGYFSSINDELSVIRNGTVYFRNLTFNFKARKPARRST